MNKKIVFLFSFALVFFTVTSSYNFNADAAELKQLFSRDKRDLALFLDNSHSQLYCVMPSNAIVGQPIRLTLQAWDWCERITKKIFSSDITFSSTDNEAVLPDTFSYKLRDKGIKTFENGVTFNTPGIHYVIVNDSKTGIWTVSNPVVVTEEESEYKWYWGELHCHSANSDGTGLLNHNYKYARDASMMDFCAITDHDICFEAKYQTLWMKLRGWEKAKNAVNRFYEPGSFVTILAYEYTNGNDINADGHYITYYNTVNDAPFYSCLDEESDRIFELWSLLKEWKNQTGHDSITIPHHLTWANAPWNSNYYDNEMVPLVEIFQVRGSCEMLNSEGNPYPLLEESVNESGYSVQDGLLKGYKFGFIAGSDDHNGHPGHHLPIMRSYLTEPRSYVGPYLVVTPGTYKNILPWPIGIGFKGLYFLKLLTNDIDKRYMPGGITGILAKDLTRGEIFNSLKDRKCIAVTNVNRMIVDFDINGQKVGDGSELHVPSINSPRIINCSIAGTSPIGNVTIMKNNEIFHIVQGTGEDPKNLSNYKLSFSILDTKPITGIGWDNEENTKGKDFYYLRIKQTNGGAGWIGPIWVNPNQQFKI